MSRVKIILLVHFVLALAPIGMRFLPPHVNALPVIWALASINLSQLMLLSIYVAMGRDCHAAIMYDSFYSEAIGC